MLPVLVAVAYVVGGVCAGHVTPSLRGGGQIQQSEGPAVTAESSCECANGQCSCNQTGTSSTAELEEFVHRLEESWRMRDDVSNGSATCECIGDICHCGRAGTAASASAEEDGGDGCGLVDHVGCSCANGEECHCGRSGVEGCSGVKLVLGDGTSTRSPSSDSKVAGVLSETILAQRKKVTALWLNWGGGVHHHHHHYGSGSRGGCRGGWHHGSHWGHPYHFFVNEEFNGSNLTNQSQALGKSNVSTENVNDSASVGKVAAFLAAADSNSSMHDRMEKTSSEDLRLDLNITKVLSSLWYRRGYSACRRCSCHWTGCHCHHYHR